uniref:Uncharacterized protein n=1 Tax=Steinernema glaseri TaxID=37863 RepID=A0A1I8A9E7_9BILA
MPSDYFRDRIMLPRGTHECSSNRMELSPFSVFSWLERIGKQSRMRRRSVIFLCSWLRPVFAYSNVF